jgi:ribosomal protein L37E
MRKTYNLGIHIKKCNRCKKPIDANSIRPYCDKCYKIIEDTFETIREYLDKFPGATAFEIEMETGIPYYVTMNFVREGRLIEIPNEFINIECKRCGRLLLSAHYKYCPECRIELERNLNRAKNDLLRSYNDNNKGKMHTIHMIQS